MWTEFATLDGRRHPAGSADFGFEFRERIQTRISERRIHQRTKAALSAVEAVTAVQKAAAAVWRGRCKAGLAAGTRRCGQARRILDKRRSNTGQTFGGAALRGPFDLWGARRCERGRARRARKSALMAGRSARLLRTAARRIATVSAKRSQFVSPFETKTAARMAGDRRENGRNNVAVSTALHEIGESNGRSPTSGREAGRKGPESGGRARRGTGGRAQTGNGQQAQRRGSGAKGRGSGAKGRANGAKSRGGRVGGRAEMRTCCKDTFMEYFSL